MEEESITKEEEERVAAGEGEIRNDVQSEAAADKNRKEKRKERKKMKRRQLRREIAEKEREEEEKKLNDPEEQRRAMELEEQEKQRMERERKEFEEREKKWLEEMEKKRKEEEMRRAQEEEEELKRLQAEKEDDSNEDGDWEYVEEGPAEIIWKGNEIIVRKKKVKVRKKNADQQNRDEASDRPTSNPLPPQTEAFAMASTEQLLENVAQQVPNFGTEQDKAHCPFHLKTGACRFGQRCSRVHFYPDKACTLLMKNMYNGPGLAREHDEGLEYTDEEVERCYEEFYEDVHTEFLKYGEIVNFKVCKNSSSHLRGNVYVQYKSLDSAVLAYHSFNGRYFAGKQVQCEYVNVTRWKIAICGEYMKSRLKECSRGSACNFIHCFRNPGGDYEWADWDKPPPRYWVKEMAGLFGYSYDSEVMDQEETENLRKSKRKIQPESDRFHKTRSRSREVDHLSSSGRNSKAKYPPHEEDNHHRDHRNRVSHSDRGLPDKNSEKSPDRSGRKIKGWDYNSDDERSVENRKHHSHMERSLGQKGRKRSVDNREDVKGPYRKKEEEKQVHSKNKSSRHRSSPLDDYNGTHDADDSDSSERHRSHKRRRARKSNEDTSDDEVYGGKISEKSYSGKETETGKSKSRREKSGRGSRDRSRSSVRSVERNSDAESLRTRENRGSSVDHYSGHNHIEEDRWKPDSPIREQNST